MGYRDKFKDVLIVMHLLNMDTLILFIHGDLAETNFKTKFIYL